jgi:hypothetical protein
VPTTAVDVFSNVSSNKLNSLKNNANKPWRKYVKFVLASLLAINLVGCATPPRFVSNYFNANDPCQYAGKREGYQLPNWCGASTGKVVNVQQGLNRNNYIVTVK